MNIETIIQVLRISGQSIHSDFLFFQSLSENWNRLFFSVFYSNQQNKKNRKKESFFKQNISSIDAWHLGMFPRQWIHSDFSFPFLFKSMKQKNQQEKTIEKETSKIIIARALSIRMKMMHPIGVSYNDLTPTNLGDQLDCIV